MPSAFDRIDHAPPRDAGAASSFGLALLIHAALIAALTWGVNWKRTDSTTTLSAELWSSVPSDAAPVAQITPVTPVTPVTPALPPEPSIKPAVVPAPPEPTPNADIALEQEKKRKLVKEQKLAQEKAERDKAKILQAQADKAKALKADQLAKADQARADAAKESQKEAQKEAQKELLKAKQSQQTADKQREDNLKRLNEMMAKAGGGASGGSSGGGAGGTSRASAGGKGTSTTYGAIATAAVKPNVVFTEAFDGNPLAKIEVRLQLDGTIISSRVIQASGNDSWDRAVLNAVIRTGRMPKDVDGKLPDTILILEFKPRF